MFNKLFKTGEIIEIRMIPKSGSSENPKSQFIEQSDRTDTILQKIIEINNNKYNIYYGVHPRVSRGEKSKVSRMTSCFIDVDSKDFRSENEFKNHIQYLDTKLFPHFKMQPSIKVFTGHGYHYYWILAEEMKQERWKDIQIAMIEVFRSDATLKDTARILRLPGSMNIKKDPAVRCEIIYENENVYTENSFQQVLSQYQKIQQQKKLEREYEKKVVSGDRETFVNAVLTTLEEHGGGMFSDYSNFRDFIFASKSEEIPYSRIDSILQKSDGYDAEMNEKMYEQADPKSITFGKAYYFAQEANEERLKELLKPKTSLPAREEKISISAPTPTAPLKPAFEPIKTFSLQELAEKHFEPTKWLVQDILPEGLSLLIGKPKVGKSFLALNMAFSIARGSKTLGKLDTEKAGVLYLAIDDRSEKRLQTRIAPMLQKIKEAGEMIPANLEFATSMKTLQEGGLQQLGELVYRKPDVKLIIVDVFQKIRKVVKSAGNAYESDTEFIQKIHDFCVEKKVSVLLLHHTKKAKELDFIDDCSGSTGITGGVDTIIKLSRSRKDDEAILEVTGRDIEKEYELAIRFNQELLNWELLGDAQEIKISKERQEIIDVLKDGIPHKLKDIADKLDKPVGAIKQLCHKLCNSNIIYHVSPYGYLLKNNYSLNSNPITPVTCSNPVTYDNLNNQVTGYCSSNFTSNPDKALQDNGKTDKVTEVTEVTAGYHFDKKSITSLHPAKNIERDLPGQTTFEDIKRECGISEKPCRTCKHFFRENEICGRCIKKAEDVSTSYSCYDYEKYTVSFN